MAFVSLAVIAGAAFVCPVLAALVPGRAIPETVFLLLAGAVLGPHMLGLIHIDEAVSIVSELGLAFLFLLAGYEINPKHVVGGEGRWGLGAWAVSFLLAWLAVRMVPAFSAGSIDGIAVTLALISTALGTLMPILHERSLMGTRLGDSILAYGTWGELGPVLAMSVLLSARSSVQTLMILAAFLVVCVVLAAVPARSRRLGNRFFRFIQNRADTTSQTFVRLTVFILIVLVAFTAIFVLRFIIPEGDHTLESKLEGLAYGFLIPVFLCVSGAKIDLSAVAANPLMLAGFIVALLVIRAVPIAIAMRLCPLTRDVTPHGRTTVALYCTTALPIIVAVTSVAVSAGAMGQDMASVLVAAGACTVFLMPLLAQATYRMVDARPLEAASQVVEHPRDAAQIIREHHDLAKLLAREHKVLTSHGHGDATDEAPTWGNIAEHIAADPLHHRSIDDRIATAAHLLAEDVYENEVDPSSLSPRERRRLERAKLAVQEYRRRMLELHREDDAE